MSNTEIAANKIETVRMEMNKYKGLIAQAIPQYLDIGRVMALFFTALQKTPKLLDCTRESLFGALVTTTQLGLEIDSTTNQAHIIPYGDKATLIIGYKGLETMAIRTKLVTRIVPRIVYEGDDFSYSYGLNQHLDHTPKHKTKNMTHVYALGKMANGEQEFIVMDRDAVEKIRRRSKASQDGPWVTDESAMWCKTAVRQICKILPNTSLEAHQMHKAVALDERVDAGLPQNLELAINPNATAEPDKPPVQEPKRASAAAETNGGNKAEPTKNHNKTDRSGMKMMAARFPGKCEDCGGKTVQNSTIFYDGKTKKAYHEHCPA